MAGDDKHSGNSDQNPKTSFISLKKPYLVIIIGLIFTFLVILIICFIKRCSKSNRQRILASNSSIPAVSKEITVVKDDKENVNETKKQSKEDHQVNITVGKESIESSSPSASGSCSSSMLSDDVLFGWGRWYSYRELEIAARGFCKENVIGEGGYGVVYTGVLPDGSLIAIKNLFNNKGQAEKKFRVEVEAIGKVRHKNLVGLLGYCVEGVQRCNK